MPTTSATHGCQGINHMSELHTRRRSRIAQVVASNDDAFDIWERKAVPRRHDGHAMPCASISLMSYDMIVDVTTGQ